MDTIDALALQELRETCEEVRDGIGGEMTLNARDARLITALMDERDERIDVTAAPQDEAPAPEGLREAARLVVQERDISVSSMGAGVSSAIEDLRAALARPAAAEGMRYVCDECGDEAWSRLAGPIRCNAPACGMRALTRPASAEEVEAIKADEDIDITGSDVRGDREQQPHAPTVAAALREVAEAWIGSDPSSRAQQTFAATLRRTAREIEEGCEDG
jgi:DNA-directed RNA polymerase subunit RPC12/RpoP